jgi:hypothetical protein
MPCWVQIRTRATSFLAAAPNEEGLSCHVPKQANRHPARLALWTALGLGQEKGATQKLTFPIWEGLLPDRSCANQLS